MISSHQVSMFRTSLRQVNLLCTLRALKGVCGGRKIYTGSGRHGFGGKPNVKHVRVRIRNSHTHR
jgi:hypothetical protein